MPLPLLGALRISVRRVGGFVIVICIAFALVIYGLSGSLLSILGAQHRHNTPFESVSGATMVPSITMSARTVGMALEDFRRLPTALHAHGHSHSHSDLERHHHDSGDSTVIALGGDSHGATATDDGSPSTAPHLLAIASQSAVSLPGRTPAHWEPARPAAIEPWIADNMERPPKA